MSCDVIGQTGFYAAQLSNSFQLLVASRVGFLSSGDNLQVAVKECLQVVFCKVLDIRVCQACKSREHDQAFLYSSSCVSLLS